ncbi:serine hydrolase domain-containing protein [Micromonospora sp. NPDC005367]|uniref:serine hydrolase domain-containing protein n=1 Tax=Micromonospora sp. NPDC005367 TaxID=3155590 RepID=UPI0033A7501C
MRTDELRRPQATAGGFSPKRLTRLRELLERHVESGFVPGAVAVLARKGAKARCTWKRWAISRSRGQGRRLQWRGDTICRLGSMTKPIVAACAITLVEDLTLRLDDPVDDLHPELASMTVLTDPHGPLRDTVAARRPIILRDLLTGTLGTGTVPAEPGTIPIAGALDALGYSSPDEWMRQLGELPLVHQPGERWMHDSAANVTGVLIARATGMSFGEALRERICGPLGMKDTAFSVSGESIGRLATAYEHDNAATGEPVVEDGPDGRFSRPRAFESNGGGLVSTADDYLAFASALLAGGTHQGQRILSRPSVALMTGDHLTPEQKAISRFWPGYFDAMGWGFGMSIRTRRTQLFPSVGSYGWPGFYGTAWYIDPAEDLTAIFMMQRAHAGDQRLPMWHDLWTAVYQAIDD